jgi:protoporphyrinogen oxidase
MDTSVIIIGGGLSGITAARQLQKDKVDFILLEATDQLGGRIKTDIVNGFRLDHGFQVLLTAYPEVQQWLDYQKLNLKKFLPGAQLLLDNGKQSTLGDPLRDFSSLIPTLFSSVATLKDKLLILKLKQRLAKLSIEEIFNQKEIQTREALSEEYGFSEKIVSQFFKPFFTGIFLEKELKTSRRMFDFVFKQFGEGYAAVPNKGMQAIPELLAEPLAKNKIQLNTRVSKIEKQAVQLSNGSSLKAPHIILATEATGLINELHEVKTNFQSTTHLHFTSNTPPIQKPIIALNTKKQRLVNNICTINKVAPAYAKEDENLISLSVVGETGITEKDLAKEVKKELRTWFGNETETWEHLHTRTIHYALPNQDNVLHSINNKTYLIRKGLYQAGDHLLNGSINASMKTGKEVAQLIFNENK